jgi:hypothetical protein
MGPVATKRPMATKRKVSLTLDEDLVAALEEDEGTLSSVVNEAVRQHVHLMQQQRALRAMLDRMDREYGPLDTPEDLAEIARLTKLFESLD